MLKERIVGKEKNAEGVGGGGGDKKVILSKSTLHKSLTTKQAKKNDISKQHSKQAIRQGKLRNKKLQNVC